jgi:hypothetical protein
MYKRLTLTKTLIKRLIVLAFVFTITFFHSQTIQGSFPSLPNQKVKFGVFDGFKSSNYISCKR